MRVTYKNPEFEHSVDSIMLFQTDETAPNYSDALPYFYPQVDLAVLRSKPFSARKEYLMNVLSDVYAELEPELNRKVLLYNEHFSKYENQINDALSDAFETDVKGIFNDLVGNICLNPVSPRFLPERCFDVFCKNSERGALGISIHEVIHFIWFYVWNKTFGDSYDEYEMPSMKWILSEMVVESIMRDERLSSINPYFPREHGGCVYSYFQYMIVSGKYILDTLEELYRKNKMTDFMAKSYDYCIGHEKEIRRHIQEAEKTF